MKHKIRILALLCWLMMLHPVFAQYVGGSFGGYASSRSDDILYDGSSPVVTGAELPDVVHKLTIDNPAGVTLSKSITVTDVFSILNGDFDLNGNSVVFGDHATLVETPGHTITGAGGKVSITRTLNNLTTAQNIAGLGLEIITNVPLGETTISRGHASQQIGPTKLSSTRFFDVAPTNNANLNAEVEFHYDASELNGIPEADLALFKSEDAALVEQGHALRAWRGLGKSANGQAIAAVATWQFLGGTVNAQAQTVSKGGVPDFSRLAIGRGFVFLADNWVKIDGNETSEGDIHSNGKISFEKGEPGTHSGNLTAVTDIEIEKNNTIAGSAVAGGALDLSDNATVTGTTAENTEVLAIGLPTPSFTAGGADQTVPKRGSLSLLPGSYGQVEVKKGGTLHLTVGDYFINELDTDDDAKLAIDVSAGPVNVNVVEDLEFDEDVEIIITPLGQAGTNQVTFTTLQDHKLDIGEGCLILGWIIAPKAEVHFSEDCRFKGAAVARAISVEDGVPFLPHSSSIVLQKRAPAPDNGEVEDEASSEITDYELAQNYPNPFNPSTTIRFSLKEAGEAELIVYNLRGQKVRTLISGQMNAGAHTAQWDGRDDRGHLAPSGIYFYKLRVNGFVQTKKMTLMK